ncbi:LOW QUALITY PROTEIN: RGG repeats nuclear RNA binding protein A-like [Primulina tabacum]|uniref:LOW QUALITY PROTEIN: RGG repeats nuclear RNA binding protein A-like n=1 Tax=Primulina tabacum TaxID=48773 RepID=UPI003F598FE1
MMSSINPFGLLGDDDSEDPIELLASKKPNALAQAQGPAQAKKAPALAPAAQAKPPAKLPSKPVPPAQAVRESKNEDQRGGGRGAVRGGGRGRGGRGFNRDVVDNENAFGITNGFSRGYKQSEDGDAGKDSSERRPYSGPRGGGGFRGGRRGGISNGESTEGERERPRRAFDRHSGTGRGSGFKREGAGRGNWGTPVDEIATGETEEPVVEGEKNVDAEKPSEQEDVNANKETPANEPENKEPEEKEMTLEEYEKVLEEKRKALVALKSEERKVNLDKELESMQILSNKKNDDEFFVKLGSDKDKRKEAAEKAKKSVSINEFLKPAKGEYPRSGGRGQGRGRGRGGAGVSNYNVQALAIADDGEFPSLAGK